MLKRNCVASFSLYIRLPEKECTLLKSSRSFFSGAEKEGWERNDGIEGPILLLAPVCVSTFCSSVTLFPRLFPL